MNGARACSGVVRSALGGHSLALTCVLDMTTPEVLPSRRVLLHGVPDPPGVDPDCQQNLDIVFVMDVSTTMQCALFCGG